MKKPIIFIISALFILPVVAQAAMPPIYATLKRIDTPPGTTSSTLYYDRGIVGVSLLYSCSSVTMQCAKIEKVPDPISFAERGARAIKFSNTDESVLIAFSQEQQITTALFYHRDDYTAYKTIQVPFEPSRALFSSDGKAVVFLGLADNAESSLFSIDLTSFTVGETEKFDRSKMSAMRLSPDGKWIAYYISTASTKGEHTIGLYSIASKKFFTIKTKNSYWDLLSESNRLFTFSDDGKYFAYLDDRDGYQSVYNVGLSSTMTSISGRKISAAKTVANDLVYVGGLLSYVHNGTDPYLWTLSLYDPVTKKITDAVKNVSYTDNLLLVDGKILTSVSTSHGFDPVLFDVHTNSSQAFTFVGENWSTTPVDSLTRTLVKTGTTTGILLSKSDLKKTDKLPLVIWLHGGPYRQAAKQFNSFKSYGPYDWALDELAETGTVRVLKLDYRGSFGFGLSKAKSLVYNVGKGDVQDVMDAVNSLKKTYRTTNIYTVGNSYGAYLALRTEVAYPKTIQGAISINGVTDWDEFLTYLKTSIFNVYFDGVPRPANKAMYAKASIINRVKNLSADTNKIILIQGVSDTTVTPSQAPLLDQSLKDAGKKTEMILLDGENHVYAKPGSLEIVCQKMFEIVGIDKTDHCVYSLPPVIK